MKVRARRWCVAVVASIGAFAGCWWGLVAGAGVDNGLAAGVAVVPFTVVLTVLGAWAGRDDGNDNGVAPGPVVVGDIPQEPAAFQLRPGLLDALLRANRTPVSAVTGLLGTGKTQVAGAVARTRLDERWRLVAWVDASDIASLLAGLKDVAVAWGVGKHDEDAGELAMRVRNRMESDGKRCLLIFDGANELDRLRPFLPAGGKGQVVITSTRQKAATLGTEVAVEVFTASEAVAFLERRTGQSDDAGALEVAEALGRLPLGLAQAAAVIAADGDYKTYVNRLRVFPVRDYLGPIEGDRYPRGLAEAILLSLTRIEARDGGGLCAAVMNLLAVLSETGVPQSIIHAAAGQNALSAAALRQTETGDLSLVSLDKATMRLADASLVAFSLDTAPSARRISAHRLVTRVVRERLIAEGRLVDVGAVAARLLTGLADAVVQVGDDYPGAQELLRQAAALEEHIAPHLVPGSEAELTEQMLRLRMARVRLLTDLGQNPDEAVRLAELLASECEQAFGTDNPLTLTCRARLAAAYDSKGRAADAIRVAVETLADRERVLGSDHPDTLASRHTLAHAHANARHLTKAVRLWEQTLADQERVLGADHRDTMTSQSSLAQAYTWLGRPADALPLLEQGLATRERMLGATHPNTLNARNVLAVAYLTGGQQARGLTLLHRTAADEERLLGSDHPLTLVARDNIAEIYANSFRKRKAIRLRRQIVADYIRVLGPCHPDTLLARINLAIVYARCKRFVPALALLTHALTDAELAFDADNAIVLHIKETIATLQRNLQLYPLTAALIESTFADKVDKEPVRDEQNPS